MPVERPRRVWYFPDLCKFAAAFSSMPLIVHFLARLSPSLPAWAFIVEESATLQTKLFAASWAACQVFRAGENATIIAILWLLMDWFGNHVIHPPPAHVVIDQKP